VSSMYHSEKVSQLQGVYWNEEDWQSLLKRLPNDWEEQAIKQGAWRRVRKLTRITDVLRGRLVSAVCSYSFRELGVWATLVGIGSLSERAWRKRMERAQDWIGWMLGALIGLQQYPGGCRGASPSGHGCPRAQTSATAQQEGIQSQSGSRVVGGSHAPGNERAKGNMVGTRRRKALPGKVALQEQNAEELGGMLAGLLTEPEVGGVEEPREEESEGPTWVICHWRLAQCALETLQTLLRGSWTRQRQQDCVPDLRCYLVSRDRQKRRSQEMEVQGWLFQRRGLAEKEETPS
jgi:hypothetical protein